jgi:N-carbamoylputrescine amidase
MVKVGIVQMQSELFKVEANLKRAEKYVEQAAEEGAELVVLPEMFNVGFYFGEELMKVAETLEGKTVSWMKEQAALNQVHIICSIYEQHDGHFYNTMVMVGTDGDLQYYRKRNPTWQEFAVWKRCDDPGPGIFDTPFGRVGGAICFDSFSRETFQGFQKSEVKLVIIVACWGAPRNIRARPETFVSRAIMKKWSHLASEVVPYQYAVQLAVPAIFVNQGGVTRSPAPMPRPYPFPLQEIVYDFQGRSKVIDSAGKTIICADEKLADFCSVVSLDIKKPERRQHISRSDIPASYLSSDYYFVKPPIPARIFQYMCYKGLTDEYENRRIRY